MKRLIAVPVLGFSFLLLACVTAPERLALAPASFADLPGWQDDHQKEAVSAFARSCTALMKKPDDDALWQASCAALAQTSPSDDAAARAFFERYFAPYAASGSDGEEGLFTGYYEADLRGSRTKTRRYRFPLYARPHDLVTADLGLFKPEWKGKRITGKVTGSEFVPYDDRAAIEEGALKKRARVLLWVDDPVDAFFLSIQGSGRVRLPDRKIVHVGYDGANGRTYTAIGRALAEMGALEKPVTMNSIRAWLAENPDRAKDIMDTNKSYVFFRLIKGPGPLGAEGVALTPLRSLAIDPSFVPLGTPLWLVTETPDGMPLTRLMIAQDTGGAIKGVIRGDVFWGAGQDAAAMAGAMQSKGRYYFLLPKGVGEESPHE
jgi:membrane-bound lytic murein transglycosylase A